MSNDNSFIDQMDRDDVAAFLGVKRSTLTYVLYGRGTDSLYKHLSVKKKSGGFRELEAPLPPLNWIQKQMEKALYDQAEKENFFKENKLSHAYQKNRSIITNAKVHRNKRFVLCMDIKDFFGSFHFGRVRGFFEKNRHFQMGEKAANVWAQLACYDWRLPQGAPTSPIITNLICRSLDFKLLKLSKKFHVDYSRYADDLTFSTNDKRFAEVKDDFVQKVTDVLKKSGFEVNDKKTRFQFKTSRQKVTGLSVNKKINATKDFRRKTRAMLFNQTVNGRFYIGEDEGTLNKLEGRLEFMYHLDDKNQEWHVDKHNFRSLDSIEYMYQEFLFYKLFFGGKKAVVVTEGKTDPLYIEAALRSLHADYPDLIEKKSDGTFKLKFSFLHRTKKLSYFLNLVKDGADAINNLYQFFRPNSDKFYPNYILKFKRNGQEPQHPVFFMFDNELQESKNRKPLRGFLNKNLAQKQGKGTNENRNRIKEELENEYVTKFYENLFILTTPLYPERVADDGRNLSRETEIEDLFDSETLKHKINGKRFERKNSDSKSTYGKQKFAEYILNNYQDVDFQGFKPVLDNLNRIIKEF